MDLALAIELDAGRGALGVVDPEGTVLDNEPLEGDTETSGLGRGARCARGTRPAACAGGRIGGDVVVCGVGMELGDEGAVDELRARLRELTGSGGVRRRSRPGLRAGRGLGRCGQGCRPLRGSRDRPNRARWDRARRPAARRRARPRGTPRARDRRTGRSALRVRRALAVCRRRSLCPRSRRQPVGRSASPPTRGCNTLAGSSASGSASVANLLDLKLLVCGGRVAREYSSTMFLAAQEELDTPLSPGLQPRRADRASAHARTRWIDRSSGRRVEGTRSMSETSNEVVLALDIGATKFAAGTR